MKRMHLLAASLTLAAATLGMTTAVQAQVSRGALMATTCFACHGTDGQSPGAMPSISGYPPDTMIRQLKAFQDGSRQATVMDRHATGYTDEEIRLMAEYLSTL
ncbi:MAG: c-type cytochrome [Ectothiorhodospira sp.]